MSWANLIDDDYQRPDGPVGNGFVDAHSIYSVENHKLKCLHQSDAIFFSQYLRYNSLLGDQRVILTTDIPTTEIGSVIWYVPLRISPDGNKHFTVSYGGGNVDVWRFDLTAAPPYTLVGRTAVSGANETSAWELDAQAEDLGGSAVRISYTLSNAGSPVLSGHFDDSTAGYQYSDYATSYCGVGIDGNTNPQYLTRTRIYNTVFGGSVLTPVPSTPTENVLTWTESAGATGYEIHASQSATFTPSLSTRVYNGLGTSYTHATGQPPGTTTYYILRATNGSATVDTLPVACVQKFADVNTGMGGDSITNYGGDHTSYTAMMVKICPGRSFPVCKDDGSLGALLDGSSGTPHTQGVPGSTTADWRPDSANRFIGGKNCFENALYWFQLRGVTEINLMLGANDCGAAHLFDKATYKANMIAICAGFVTAGMKVILHDTIYPRPSSRSGYTAAAPGLAQSYGNANDEICDQVNIFRGDKSAFGVFAAHPEYSDDDIHPNPAGQIVLQELHAVAHASTRGYITPVPSSGSVTSINPADVRKDIDMGGGQFGTCYVPTAANTKLNIPVDGTVGTYDGSDRWTALDPNTVLSTVNFRSNSLTNNRAGTVTLPTASQLLDGVTCGPGNAVITGNVVLPPDTKVVYQFAFGPSSSLTGRVRLPLASQVVSGAGFGVDGTELTGTHADSGGGSGGGGSSASASDIVDAFMAHTIDNVRLDRIISVMFAADAGEVQGAGTETVRIKAVNSDQDRIVADVDNRGNRFNVTLNF